MYFDIDDSTQNECYELTNSATSKLQEALEYSKEEYEKIEEFLEDVEAEFEEDENYECELSNSELENLRIRVRQLSENISNLQNALNALEFLNY